MVVPPTPSVWQTWPDAAVAACVRRRGSAAVAVVDGTRRWYHFTHLRGQPAPAPADYLTAGAAAHAALLALLLAHGLEPLFIPLLIPLTRGPAYVERMLGAGLPALLADPGMAPIYAHARVRLYPSGLSLPPDWRAAQAAQAAIEDRFAHLRAVTAGNAGPRLYFGLHFAASDPAATVLAPAAALQAALGRAPTRAELVAALYGPAPEEALPPVRLFLSSELQASPFVPPLLAGEEELYFTTDSLLALDRPLLRAILYDYVFLRPGAPGTDDPADYTALAPAARQTLAAWYAARGRRAFALGTRHPQGGFWVPDLRGSADSAT